MFTGIIQSIGTITKIKKNINLYTIKTTLDLEDCKKGSSICCDGVCLTTINVKKNNEFYIFDVNISEETLKRSNLIFWQNNTKINIEKSLKVGDELSGHFVYGHVDLQLIISEIKKLNNSWEFIFSFSTLSNRMKLKKFFVEKGSITINGISLTIANVYEDCFTVSIIPYTFENTNLSILKVNDQVNIEFDPLARYINEKY